MSQFGAKVATIPKRRTKPGFRFLPIPLTIHFWPITPAERAVWQVIWRHTYHFGKVRDALALSVIASESFIGRSTAIRAIAELERLGLLVITRKFKTLSEYECRFDRFMG